MNKKRFCCLAAIFFAGLTLIATSSVAADLTARRTSKAPQIDGKVDSAWSKIRPTRITVDGKKIGKVKVSMKAMYDREYIYLLIQWADKNLSQNRVYEMKGGKWVKRKGNEDRFGIAFDIGGNITDFNKKGCEILCHNDGEYMATSKPGQKADIWHWKAQRTNPIGYADDQWIQDVVKSGHEKTARKSDKKSGGSYSSNFDKKKKQPKFLGPGKGGPVLLKANAKAYGGGVAEGTVAPRETLARPKGSRGDIDASGIWKKGKWTLELRRKLNTGNKDDVAFEPGKTYYFGISVFDNGDGDAHSVSKGANRLTLKN